MKVDARGKINLTLNVTGRRENGYHDLELIFQPVSLCDTLFIEKKPDPGLAFSCSVKHFETADNLVCKAYDRLAERYPQVGGLTVFLKKRIPSGAGMGGGSTDAAAMILAMDRLFALGMSWDEKVALGASLGADVPACMLAGASQGRGIGEKLERIRTDFSFPLLIIKPRYSFSTAEMYRAIDESEGLHQKYCSAQAREALENNDLEKLCRNLYNVFEEAVPGRERILALKETLLAHGAAGSLMTGSGSCVYGIFESRRLRDRAYGALRKKYLVFACEAVNEELL